VNANRVKTASVLKSKLRGVTLEGRLIMRRSVHSAALYSALSVCAAVGLALSFNSAFATINFVVTTYSTGNGPEAVAIGDLNGDGKADIVTADVYGNTVSILYGNGDGTFQPPVSIPLPSNGPHDVQIVDMNGDGKLDIVTEAGGCNSYVVVLLNNDDGTFSQRTTGPLAPCGINGVPVVADLNGDGIPDVVVPFQYANVIALFRQTSG
jgi:hypothetical protein